MFYKVLHNSEFFDSYGYRIPIGKFMPNEEAELSTETNSGKLAGVDNYATL